MAKGVNKALSSRAQVSYHGKNCAPAGSTSALQQMHLSSWMACGVTSASKADTAITAASYLTERDCLYARASARTQKCAAACAQHLHLVTKCYNADLMSDVLSWVTINHGSGHTKSDSCDMYR